MAIDDNTLYGLTGAQVKELPDKIRELGKDITELTASDYNYPTANPDGINPLALSTGVYKITSGMYAYVGRNVQTPVRSQVSGDMYFIVDNNPQTSSKVTIIYPAGAASTDTNGVKWIWGIIGNNAGTMFAEQSNVLTSQKVQNNLTSTDTLYPLSANQGRVLKSQIGDLTTLDTTVQTDLVSAINEVAAGGGGGSYTAGDGIDITNSVISATNTGKAKVLTTDDYNWHSTGDVDDKIAAWLLPDGVYVVKDSPVLWVSSSTNYTIMTFVKGTNSNGVPYLLGFNNARTITLFTLRANGSTYDQSVVLRNSDVVNNLTSTSTNTPLSAAQGKALKDLIDAIVVPTQTSDLTNDGSDGTSTYVEADELATVATSGSYNDLSNKPTIPTVNDATLTIQANGTTVNSFTANASSNVTANIPSATTSRYGVTELSSSTSSTSTTLAATPSAVKSAYDLANGKATITITSTDPGEGSTLAANNYVAVYGADALVQTADIADGAVTSGKIDFTTLGDQSSYIDFGSLRVQFGSQTGGRHNASTSVNLPVAFADSNYTVVVTNQFNETGSSFWWAFVVDKTTTTFTYRSGFKANNDMAAGGDTTNNLNWIAIGNKPS